MHMQESYMFVHNNNLLASTQIRWLNLLSSVAFTSCRLEIANIKYIMLCRSDKKLACFTILDDKYLLKHDCEKFDPRSDSH